MVLFHDEAYFCQALIIKEYCMSTTACIQIVALMDFFCLLYHKGLPVKKEENKV